MCVCVCAVCTSEPEGIGERCSAEKKTNKHSHTSVNNNNTEYFAHRLQPMQRQQQHQQHRNSIALHCNEHAGNDARCECMANGVWHMMSTSPSIRCVVIFAFSFYAVYIHICARDMAFAIHTALEWVKTKQKIVSKIAMAPNEILNKRFFVKNSNFSAEDKFFKSTVEVVGRFDL